MRYLLLGSTIFLLAACSSVYKNLQPATGSFSQLKTLMPDVKLALYKAEVDVIGHHLSGLLMVKVLPDSSTRVVFSSETGFKFLDFGFSPNGQFTAYYVVKQMDKKPIIKTLKKDFELVFINKQDTANGYVRKADSSIYFILPKPKGTYCYITDLARTKITMAEICSPRKAIVQAIMENYTNGVPDTIGITHRNFNFTIALKKIERNASE